MCTQCEGFLAKWVGEMDYEHIQLKRIRWIRYPRTECISSLKQHFILKRAAFRPHKKVEKLVLVLFQKLIYISFKCHRLDINISFSFQMGAWQPYFTQKFALNSHFTLKFAVFCAITRKPLVRKCCEWSQKMLLGPLSTLDKSNSMTTSILPKNMVYLVILP